MSLQRRRERKTIIHTWKIKNEMIRNDVNLSFEINQRTSRVRAIIKPMPRVKGKVLSIHENSFSIRAGKLWNRLPSILTTELTLSSFVCKLDQWLKMYPDEPPVLGYFQSSRNSILDYPTRTLASST